MANRRQGPATIYDVASMANVSITTVSRYLNNPKSVKEQTADKIAKAMEALDYIPKGNAGSRANRNVGRIGVLTPFFPAPSFVDRLEGLIPVLRQKNYEMVVYTVEGDDQLDEYLNSVPFTRRLDGLILMSVRLSETQHNRLSASGLQIIMIESDDENYTRILANDYRGGKLAAELFVRKNYFPCLYMSENRQKKDYSLNPAEKRLNGFRDGLASAEKEITTILESDTSVEDAEKVFDEYLMHNKPPRAVFAMSDLQAIGILKSLKKKAYSVPEITAVLGFDDISQASWMDISTITQNLKESGRIAGNLLIDKIKENITTIQQVNLQVELVERSTT